MVMTWHAVRSPAARRGFALAALATGAAPVVLTVPLLLRDPLELIAAVLLVDCAVAATWAALVHRGRRRIPAAVTAVLALAATVALPDLRAPMVPGGGRTGRAVRGRDQCRVGAHTCQCRQPDRASASWRPADEPALRRRDGSHTCRGCSYRCQGVLCEVFHDRLVDLS
ncbi:hypothetical protein [Kutzneria sp. 744]|uniref:hypothetical protein n=1 Tax=Kutzneria sp. (strain 744) TaxID=345341 RepID=UPI0018DD57AF|nr:hypothetical protein [Kutzneria sp. 744]